MRVSSPMPQLDIKSTRATLQIKTDPLRLKVESRPAKMHVRRTRPRMKVNWKKVRSECGLRMPSAQRRYLMQKYRRIMLQGIQQSNQMNQQISDIQNHVAGGPELVASVTLQQLMQQDIPVVDIASMPQSSPEIEWEPGSIEIEWEPASLEMHWEGSIRPEISVTPHTVEIRLINGETIRVAENEAASLERRGYGKRIDQSV